MIDLTYLKTNGDTPALIDFGGILRPATGARILRIDRLGSRFRQTVHVPPMRPDKVRSLIADLIRGKSEGVRIYFPLEGVNQGYPGSPVVDGAGQAGRTILLRGLTPRYAARKGYWLSIVDENGQHYLHNVSEAAIAGADGTISLRIEPMLRWPFPDGSAVHLARPMIEGLVDGEELSWNLAMGRWVDSISFTIEEAA